jgi:hypothetical protein
MTPPLSARTTRTSHLQGTTKLKKLTIAAQFRKANGAIEMLTGKQILAPIVGHPAGHI